MERTYEQFESIDSHAQHPSGVNAALHRCSTALRREISDRNRFWASAGGVAHQLTRGEPQHVVYFPDAEDRHGNFLPETYRAICACSEWSARLKKVHSTARHTLPSTDRRWRELDSCHSSDALLMNVFCHPATLSSSPAAHALLGMLGLTGDLELTFGHRPRIPLVNGYGDRTEVDLKIGSLLIEAKLTEADFQRAPASRVESYLDFESVFSMTSLPRAGNQFLSYQLIRGTLAAYATGESFCVLCDARRRDLIEAWYAVMLAVLSLDLRLRLKLLTWQELSPFLPQIVREFLDCKYGIQA